MTTEEIKQVRDKATAAIQAVLWVVLELFVLGFAVNVLWEWAKSWTW